MGAVLDTTIFVDLERQSARRGPADPIGLIGRSLEQSLGPEEEVGISSITVSELLHGVHRATPEYRPRREAFVESVISIVPVMEFDLLAARSREPLGGTCCDWRRCGGARSDRGCYSYKCRVACGNHQYTSLRSDRRPRCHRSTPGWLSDGPRSDF